MPAGAERGQREVGSPRERATQKLQYLMMATTAAAALTFPSLGRAQTASEHDSLALDVGNIDAPPTPPQVLSQVRSERPPVSVRVMDHRVDVAEFDRVWNLAFSSLPHITGPDNVYTRNPSHRPIYRQALSVGESSSAPNMNRVTETFRFDHGIVSRGNIQNTLESSPLYCTFETRGAVHQEAQPRMSPDGFAVPNAPLTLSDARQRMVVSCYDVGSVYNNPYFAVAPLTSHMTGSTGERPNHVMASHVGATAEQAVFFAMADLMRQNSPFARDRVNYSSGDQVRGALTFVIQRDQGDVVLDHVTVRVAQQGQVFNATVEADAFAAIPMERAQ